MSEKRREFDPDFKDGAVRIVLETGRPVAEVARELGVHGPRSRARGASTCRGSRPRSAWRRGPSQNAAAPPRPTVGPDPRFRRSAGGRWRVGLYAGFCPDARGSVVAIHLGRRLPAGSSGLPGSDRTGRPLPVWPCSGWGLPSRPGHPGRWCALTAPFHPYLCGDSEASPPSAVCSLWHFPAGHPDWALPSTLPCGVRTFLGPVAEAPVRGHPADSPPDNQSRANHPTPVCSIVAPIGGLIARTRWGRFSPRRRRARVARGGC